MSPGIMTICQNALATRHTLVVFDLRMITCALGATLASMHRTKYLVRLVICLVGGITEYNETAIGVLSTMEGGGPSSKRLGRNHHTPV